jgi:N-carbamoylputrescine amidase
MLSVGFLFATEFRSTDEAVLYGREGVHVLATPRSTSRAETGEWLAAARRSAALAGTYSLSSNRVDDSGRFDGQGWIVAPDGELLALTDREQPFRSVVIDVVQLDRIRLKLFRVPPARYGPIESNEPHWDE